MDPTWEEHKDEIERLYIRQDKPLKEVMEILRKRRSFNKTKKQYETAFKEWGFRKYKFNTGKWKIVNRKVQKRKRELGKESEVHVDGIQYPPEKVRVGILKHGFLPTAELYSVPSPEMPEGIVVCSPIPVETLQWPCGLPWLQFLQSMKEKESQFSLKSLSSAIHPIRHQHSYATWDGLEIPHTFFQYPESQKKSNMNDVSLTKPLGLVMLEECEEEHRTMSERVFGHKIDMGTQERFKLLLYLLSNNFNPVGDVSDWSVLEWDDMIIIDILHSSRLNTKEIMRHLLEMPGLTPAVIAERLFQSAVRSYDRETMTAMLDAGMDPQTPIWSLDDEISMTPLEYLCDLNRSVELASLLLSHNANVNEYSCRPPLTSALIGWNEDLINLLISEGADIGVGLESLLSFPDEYIQESDSFVPLRPILFPNTISEINIQEPEKAWNAILSLAIRSQNVGLVNLLLSRGADVNSLYEVDFEHDDLQTTALGLAAEKSNTDIIQILYMAGATANPKITANTEIVHPLTLAVTNGDFDSTVLLISCGGDVNTSDNFGTRRKTLFDRALEKEHLEICELLLRKGAVAEGNAFQSIYSKRLWSFVCANDADSVLQLPTQQVNMNHTENEYTSTREKCMRAVTVLGKAIELGSPLMIKTLVNCGSTDPGKSICKISGLRTAKCLNSLGLLPKVLGSSGQNILTAAIMAKKDALVAYIFRLSPGKMGQNQSLGQMSPMEAAITRGRLDILDALLVRDIPLTDGVLAEAVGRDSKRNEYLFLRRIADRRPLLKFRAPRAIGMAVKMRKSFLVKTLLDFGIDPRENSSPEISNSVLEMSETMDDQDLFQMLFMSADWPKEVLGRCFTKSIFYDRIRIMLYLHGLCVDLNHGTWINDRLWHPLEIAVKKEDVSLVRALIDYGCDPNKSEPLRKSRTPLQTAAEIGNVKVLDILLEAGAKVDREHEHYGQGKMTALQVAAKEGNMEVVERLLNAGADINSAPKPDSGATALQFAAMAGFIGILRRLLEEGADVNAGRAPRWGRTALEGAAEHGRVEILQVLLDHGVLIDGKGRRQYIRAVLLAEWNTHSAIAKFLRSHGKWTELDSQRAGLEPMEIGGESEPDYENDLVWNYGLPWSSVIQMVERSRPRPRTLIY